MPSLPGLKTSVTSSPSLQGHMSPAQPDQIARIIQFDAPMYNVALVVFRVQENLAMGIGPHELRNGSLQGDPPCVVVPLRSVVCPHRAAKHQRAHSQGEEGHQSTFHAAPPSLESYHGPGGVRRLRSGALLGVRMVRIEKSFGYE